MTWMIERLSSTSNAIFFMHSLSKLTERDLSVFLSISSYCLLNHLTWCLYSPHPLPSASRLPIYHPRASSVSLFVIIPAWEQSLLSVHWQQTSNCFASPLPFLLLDTLKHFNQQRPSVLVCVSLSFALYSQNNQKKKEGFFLTARFSLCQFLSVFQCHSLSFV